MNADELLSNIVIVLDRPKSLVNIANVARVMMNTGLTRLRLVDPDDYDADRVSGIAHRGHLITDHVEIHPSLGDALADCIYVVGTSARARAAQTNAVRPRNVAAGILARAAEGEVALIFGREDRGLGNDAIDRCNEVVVIPTAPAQSSLNLAQACMVLCHELFLTAGDFAPEEELGRGKKARETGLATQEEQDAMYETLAKALDRVGFFNARDAPAVFRTLRGLVGRAVPTKREVALLHAMGGRIDRYLDHLAAEKE
jgi:tRNA/rRNA methyltransferase